MKHLQEVLRKKTSKTNELIMKSLSKSKVSLESETLNSVYSSFKDGGIQRMLCDEQFYFV